MAEITAVVLTRNEEKNIERCLKSLRFCDEIIVVDDNSTDNTRLLAKKLGARIIIRSLDGDFSIQKNFALENAHQKWVLFVDADEVVPPELVEEISQVIQKPASPVLAYAIKRQDHLWGKKLKYGETGRATFVRLGRKSAGKWRRRVHETWVVNGRVEELNNPLEHYPHPTLAEYIEHINFWSTLHAQANQEEGKKSDVIKIILWPVGKFLNNYIVKAGFKDGTEGFVTALMMSLHSFLAWAKLWLNQRK